MECVFIRDEHQKRHKSTGNPSKGEVAHPENAPEDDIVEELTRSSEKTNNVDGKANRSTQSLNTSESKSQCGQNPLKRWNSS